MRAYRTRNGAGAHGRARFGGTAAAVLLVAALGPLAAAHPGPSIWGDIVLRNGAMVFTVEGAAGPLTTNLGLDVLLLGPLDPAVRDAVFARIERRFREGNPVLVDGVRVLPDLTDLVIQDGPAEDQGFRSARLVLTYPLARPPRSIAVAWDDFSGEGVEFIPIVMREDERAAPQLFSLFPDEPEYVWHASSARPRAAVPVAPVRAPRPTLDVPVASALLALVAVGAIAAWFVTRARGSARRGVPRAAAVAALLAGAILLRGDFVLAVPSPFGAGTVAIPAPDQARAIFERLHHNVYASFEARTEDEIYELLRTSVSAELLDTLYGDVYESLILREQGGAICSIESVEVLEGAVDPASYDQPGEPRFMIDWRWRVNGVVAHWGHVHRRSDECRARYTVRHDGGSWKIAEAQVLERNRVDSDA